MAVLCVNAGPVNGTADFTVSLTELGISSSKGAVVRVRDAIESIFYIICIYSMDMYVLSWSIHILFQKKTKHTRGYWWAMCTSAAFLPSRSQTFPLFNWFQIFADNCVPSIDSYWFRTSGRGRMLLPSVKAVVLSSPLYQDTAPDSSG